MQTVMGSVEENKLLRAFLEETEELLEKLNQALLELEKEPAKADLVHEIFRLIHSLKSESALIGFANLSELAHRLEDVFEGIRGGRLALKKELLEVILSTADLIHEMVSRIAQGEGDSGVEFRSLAAELSKAAGTRPAAGFEAGSQPAGVLPPVQAAGGSAFKLSAIERARVQEALARGEAFYELSFRPEGEPAMRYPRAYLVLNNLETAANVIRTEPDLHEAGAEEADYSQVRILFSSDLSDSELARCFDVDQIAEVELRRLSERFWLEEEAGPAESQAMPRAGPSASGSSTGLHEPRGAMERSSVRVDTYKLDELWQLVGELIHCKARYALLSSKLAGEQRIDLERATDALERVAGRMQQAVMQTRMVPISVLFHKFPRLVRDLARQLGKSVELELHGQDTEIDRSLVEALSEPLTHLIRNALDHGIEALEERLARGKRPTGRVAVRAQQRGGKIVVEVSDDGRGLDFERIRRKAQAAPEATDEELIGYIFLPGFSTREEVTELSGRGVGLDVVATRIRDNLKGELRIRSRSGEGLTVAIILPLTLTILHSLIVRVAQSCYAVPVQDVEETLQVEPGELLRASPGALQRLARGEGDLPAASLGLLAAGEAEAGGALQRCGVILGQQGRRVCLLVDEVVEEQDVVVKPIAEVLNPRRLFSGVSILGDGRIAFLLDAARIIELTEQLWPTEF